MTGWEGVSLWKDGEAAARACLAAGADPCVPLLNYTTPLHTGAEQWPPDLVAAMAEVAGDVDVLFGGRSPLWVAVDSGRYDNARVLSAAGADPWRPMMGGWSPGRLSLAGPEPGLFGPVPAGVGLSQAEREAVALAGELTETLRIEHYDGTGLLAVAGIGAAEAIRRLGGRAMTEDELLAHYDVEVDEDWEPPGDEDDWRWLCDVHDLLLVGITDVPGGCVVTQPWGYQPQTPVVGRTLSAGTFAYGLYANPKSGNQGSVYRDGQTTGWDLHPGGPADDSDTGEMVLLHHLYRHRAPAFVCGFAGLSPVDARCVTGPAEHWVLLPDRNYWVW